MFNRQLIAAVYEVEEYAFNSTVLAEMLAERLRVGGVELQLNTAVVRAEANGGATRLILSDESEVDARIVFNCTYAGMKRINGLKDKTAATLKHEVTEMALIQPPPGMEKFGITVMDGPFFSTMPFPPRGLHTLSHVRYTPHGAWQEDGEHSPDPYTVLADRGDRVSRTADAVGCRALYALDARCPVGGFAS